MIEYELKHSTGHVLNDAAYAALPQYRHLAAVHLGAVGSSADPPSVSIRMPQKPFDQGQTSSCTGHACSRAINTSFACARQPLPFIVSPMGIYTPARCLERAAFIVDATAEPLGDDGADAQQCSRAVSLFGVCALGLPTAMASDGRFSDADPETVNSEPDFDALLKAAKTILIGQEGIASVAEAKHALARGIGVTLAIYVDRTVDNYQRGDAPLGAPDKSSKGGWHYIMLDGYRTLEDGTTVFAWANSWGEGWGNDGFGEGDEDWFRAGRECIAWPVRKVA